MIRILTVLMLVIPPAFADSPTPGLYEIGYRMEMPHLERYAMPRSRTLCIGPAPLPIFAGNGAFEGCAVDGFEADGTRLRYRLSCPGQSGARAVADYAVSGNSFTGRIAVKLGAKNMTLIEVQTARRVGDC